MVEVVGSTPAAPTISKAESQFGFFLCKAGSLEAGLN